MAREWIRLTIIETEHNDLSGEMDGEKCEMLKCYTGNRKLLIQTRVGA